MILKSNNGQEINLEKIAIICNKSGKNAEKISDMLEKLLEKYVHKFVRYNLPDDKILMKTQLLLFRLAVTEHFYPPQGFIQNSMFLF